MGAMIRHVSRSQLDAPHRFAISHSDFGAANVVSTFVSGAVYVALALYTRWLWPSIMAHGIYDAIIMVSWVV